MRIIWLLLESELRNLQFLSCWQVSSEIKEATMTLDKLVIKCGNFAVLVDFHIAPQDRMWFSDHQREEVCLLLKDAVESRVKQYLRARKLHGRCKQTEYGEANVLSLRADEFHISAYFVKRWANLRCIGQQHSELRVFPDRFVIYVSRLEPNPSSWVSESVALSEEGNASK
ncbi:protein SLX4IP isoform X2 [Candoia aspera]|uniref:protein SLX4IP isoform X2 n=1 Tax=Candoia aspera TaxID=51853 RepID=UPI002FD856D0